MSPKTTTYWHSSILYRLFEVLPLPTLYFRRIPTSVWITTDTIPFTPYWTQKSSPTPFISVCRIILTRITRIPFITTSSKLVSPISTLFSLTTQRVVLCLYTSRGTGDDFFRTSGFFPYRTVMCVQGNLPWGFIRFTFQKSLYLSRKH